MSQVKRIYIERNAAYTPRVDELKNEINHFLGISSVEKIRLFIRYDMEQLSQTAFEKACNLIFCDPLLDELYEEIPKESANTRILCVENRPGQYDQRADSVGQCLKLLDADAEPLLKSANVYLFYGHISDSDFAHIKAYLINPGCSREGRAEQPETLRYLYDAAPDVPVYTGFIEKNREELAALFTDFAPAMTFADFLHIQQYFRDIEKRDPTECELRVLDTYWSDHCRHTTFLTELVNVDFGAGYYRKPMEASYQNYLAARDELYGTDSEKYVCLMDLAQMAMRRLKKAGKLDDMEETDEINACSIVIPVEMEKDDGSVVSEEWLLMFKNETHNHPTETEPFGGAATCLGGGIRDPLSGRGYVYQAMRISGAGNPRTVYDETLRGKLPQRLITREAAAGYATYGNQIGVPAGLVKEIYHPGFVAKRMEMGALLAAAPRSAVTRADAEPGDVIVLVGGRTGLDGVGGATGSSKQQGEDSARTGDTQEPDRISSCNAAGNAPLERNIVRLFRREAVSRLIKKCNDFGAGGVSVAIGELAPGISVELDKVPLKYGGLDGTQIAISESQERMAVVLSPADVDTFLAYAAAENLEATAVATVTPDARMVINWRGQKIADLSRTFLDTNGAHQETKAHINIPDEKANPLNLTALPMVATALDEGDISAAWLHTLRDLNVCSQKGLAAMFDDTIGAATVLLPYGGRYQLSENQAMVARLPLQNGKTTTVSLMSHGYDPDLSSFSPYHGAAYAVLESLAKIVAAGGDFTKARLSFQEYFCRLGDDAGRWGLPLSALLGAYDAQIGLGIPSIGGKDSMSGTYEYEDATDTNSRRKQIDVPPTLVSFAVCTADIGHIISPELKTPGNLLVHITSPHDRYDMPLYGKIKKSFRQILQLIKSGDIVSAYALDAKGLAAAMAKMAFGNMLGVEITNDVPATQLFYNNLGDILIELRPQALIYVGGSDLDYAIIGTVTDVPAIYGAAFRLDLNTAVAAWTQTLEGVFPTRSQDEAAGAETVLTDSVSQPTPLVNPSTPPLSQPTPLVNPSTPPLSQPPLSTPHIHPHGPRPTVFIPILPGTNGDYDMARAFELAGARTETAVFRNLSAADIHSSYREYAAAIERAQIIALPGGASDYGIDVAAFYGSVFSDEGIKTAVMRLLRQRDGLILGIGGGFKALLKLGLLPYGEYISDMADPAADIPALAENNWGRHVSQMAYLKIVSAKSPWLKLASPGGIYVNPASHSESRIVAPQAQIEQLFASGQVASVYTDPVGHEWPGLHIPADSANNSGSVAAIEGITSPDGRIYGKMLCAERCYAGLPKGVHGEADIGIFAAGVGHFTTSS